MAGNLVNMKDLDNYLKDVIYRGQEKEIFTEGNFNSIDFVEQHKDAIVRSMMFQWANYCLKPYMSTKTPQTMRFLPLINVMDGDLPIWATQCMNEGKPVYRFQADKIPDSMKEKITTARDYLYSVCEGYVNKILARAKDTQNKYAKNPKAKGNKNQEKPKIRIDYFKTNSEYADFEKVLQAAIKWHEAISENKKFKKFDEQMRKESLAGTKPIMKLEDGMEFVRLMTPEALDFESDYMGHCVGKGFYDEEIKDGSVKIYSLRDENGEPHATLELRKNKIQQCKGKNDNAPVAKYRPYLQEFVRAKKLDIEGDMQNIGLIKYKKEYYDIFNLPKDKKIIYNGDINVSGMGLTKLPDFSNLIVKGRFNCSNNQLTDLYGSPMQVGMSYDCSSNNLHDLCGISKSIGSLCMSNNPITSLDNLPQIERNIVYGINIAVEKVGDLSDKMKGNSVISNPDKRVFIVCQDDKIFNLFEQPDGFVFKGNVELSCCGLKKLPDLSNIIVEGDFCCSGNELTSFVGAPKEVGGYFEGADNKVVDLEGMPKKVGGSVILVSNHCLKSLKGISREIDEDINLNDCTKLKEIDEFPQKLEGDFLLTDDLQAKYNLPDHVSLEEMKNAVAMQKMSKQKSAHER